MTPVSAVIITYNEARNIGRCLESLRTVADDIVVLDSFSTDATEAICAEYGVRFIQHAFDGHIEQKNRAITLAKYDWVLSLDADEALSDTLRDSILACKAHIAADGYSMNRLTNYCGQWIRHSGWYPDRKLRLFDRRKAQWGGRNPHDKIVMEEGAKVLHLKGDLLHYSYYTVDEHRERSLKYAHISSRAMLAEGKKFNYLHLLIRPLAKFIKMYVLKAGFLDGRAGFTIAWITTVETWRRYYLLK